VFRLLPTVRAFVCIGAALALTAPAHGEDDASEERAPRTATKTEWKAVRRLLPDYLWMTDESARKKARVDQRWEELSPEDLTLDRAQFAQLGELLRRGSPHTTEKRRAQTLQVATGTTLPDGSAETLPVRVAVTTKYKPGCGRSFPLILTLHGGPAAELPRADEGSDTQFRVWKGFISTAHCIVAAPALTGGDHGPREWEYLRNVIDELDRLYNVDRDRILLTGHSWGGILTWYLGPANADRFALLAPFVCAGDPGSDHLANCRALPIHHVQGSRDGKWIVETGRARRDTLDKLGYEHTYYEPSGGHEVFGTQVAKIAKAFADMRRDLYAQHVTLRPSARATRGPDDWWYWIRTYAPEFEARIDRETQTIDIEGEGPFELLLADEMLDLDRPITIRSNGEIAFQGRVQRRLAFALIHVKESGDRSRVFATSIRID
jgi:pimeloyl-ACP methyl ester carboxylesterase